MSVNTQILFICGLDAAITLRISQIANELTIKCMQIKIIKFLGQKKVKYVASFYDFSEICQFIRVLHKEFILVRKAINHRTLLLFLTTSGSHSPCLFIQISE